MRATARVVTLVLVLALGAVPAIALAQFSGGDESPGDVYEQPPTTTTGATTTTGTTVGATVTVQGDPGGIVGGEAAAQTPPAAVQGQPNAAAPEGGTAGEQASGGGQDGDRAASPSRTGGRPITVNAARGASGGIRGWYAIVHLGGERDDIERHVRRALGAPLYVATLREPVALDRLSAVLKGTRFAGLGSGDLDEDLLRRFGRRVGEQLVTPGTLARSVRDALFSDFEGTFDDVSGVVLTHDSSDLKGDRAEIRDLLAGALARGARDAEIPATNGGEIPTPVVGTELTTTKPSWVPFFKEQKVSSVDNVDQRGGRRALSLLMTGAPKGHYGIKDSAQAALPQPGTGAQPIRFRTAGAVTAPAETAAGIGTATFLLIGLLTLTAGWTLGFTGRRTLRRRLGRTGR